MRSFYLLLAILVGGSLSAQQRIDSSFAFQTNPAKKYSIYVPSTYNSSRPHQMMIGFHPFNTSRWNAESWCDTLIKFSESNNLILVCPDGGTNGRIDDQIDYDFTEELVDSMQLWYNIDMERVYGIGFSVGGKAVYEFGLDHMDLFGGLIPIGPAITGSGFVSSTIHNSGREAFYLINGANDLPNSRFFPMATALGAHCAILDSSLLAGVGHTIDFPNRNQILGDAYYWIDSVNTHPQTGQISLVAPPNFATIDIKGFTDYIHQFVWTASTIQDTCGVLKYEVMLDLPGGSFSNPLYVFDADNGGEDTTLTFTNHEIDSILNDAGVAVGSTGVFEWTVRTNILGKWSDTAKSYQLTLRRKTLGFDLTSPSNGRRYNLEPNSSVQFHWTDLDHYTVVKYKLLFDDTSNSFVNPVGSFDGANNGLNSEVNLSHEDLYYQLLFPANVPVGDTMFLKWAVTASDTQMTEFSASERSISFVRGNIGYDLFSPVDKSIMISKAGTNYFFVWDSVPLPDVRYEWRVDTLGADLTNASTIYQSDNGGINSRVYVPFERLDSLMNKYGVPYHDTLHIKWTARATHPGGEEYALKTWTAQIRRAHPVGIDEVASGGEPIIYPVPADEILSIAPGANAGLYQVNLYDIEGRLVFHETRQVIAHSPIHMSTKHLPTGTYVLHLNSGEKAFQYRLNITH